MCSGSFSLYWPEYWDTPPNNWFQVFQSLPWPQVCKIMHLGMQTASTNICERMGAQWIQAWYCDWLLKIPRSTVCGIMTKWKQLGATATQPQSGRPCKITERGASAYKDILDNFVFPTRVGTVWEWALPVPTWLRTSAQSQVHKGSGERVWCGGTRRGLHRVLT